VQSVGALVDDVAEAVRDDEEAEAEGELAVQGRAAACATPSPKVSGWPTSG
jgi:hypothetical protein